MRRAPGACTRPRCDTTALLLDNSSTLTGPGCCAGSDARPPEELLKGSVLEEHAEQATGPAWMEGENRSVWGR